MTSFLVQSKRTGQYHIIVANRGDLSIKCSDAHFRILGECNRLVSTDAYEEKLKEKLKEWEDREQEFKSSGAHARAISCGGYVMGIRDAQHLLMEATDGR